MNKRRSYQQYNSLLDAAFDIRQQTPEEETITDLVEANNTTVSMIGELQERYELLSTQERERIDFYLSNVYEILGITPGHRPRNGQDFFNVLQLLLTNVKDHTVRIGRIEQLMEQLFAQFPGAQNSYSPTPQSGMPQKIVEVEREHRNHNRNRNRKTVTVTAEMRIIICTNYRKVSNAEIADACGCSLSTIEKAINQLKQEGKL